MAVASVHSRLGSSMPYSPPFIIVVVSRLSFNGTAPELAQALLESADLLPEIRAKALNSSPDSISILLKTNPGVQNLPESVRSVRLWVDSLLLEIPMSYQTLAPPVDVLHRLSFRTMGPAR